MLKNEGDYISRRQKQQHIGAVTLRVRYTKYSNNSMINLLYIVILLLIATAPERMKLWKQTI